MEVFLARPPKILQIICVTSPVVTNRPMATSHLRRRRRDPDRVVLGGCVAAVMRGGARTPHIA
eukprot:10094995-Prorocentrum_lima.AAC.1